ncbi:hypothetical protein DFH29DRAFT_884312, partial [Suillus ampliporus]
SSFTRFFPFWKLDLSRLLDIAPSGISIPTHEENMNGGPTGREEQNWNGSVRSPSRDCGGEPPRHSSRSRGPVRDDRGRGADGGGGHNPGNNLHVSNLSHRDNTGTSSKRLLKLAVKKASVMYDPHTRKSCGFGFVTMEISGGADTAITTLNATDIMGKTATVERARRGRARTPTPGRHYHQ